MHASQGERRVVVIEDAVGPEIGVVAQLARGGEAGRNVMHRAQRAVVVGLVAGHTSRAVQFVVSVDVAIGTRPRWNRVHPG